LKLIYLDHNATTQIEESAKSALLFFSSDIADPNQNFGNVSSIHWAGRKLKSAWEKAHAQVATLIGAEREEDICFLSSATEASNMAIKGAFFHHLEQGETAQTFHLITSSVEHEATLESAYFIGRLGAQVHLVSVEPSGALCLDQLEEALEKTRDKGFRMLSFMAANNETGVIFPLQQICALAKFENALLHIDAVQAPGKMQFDLREIPADLVSLSAHKIGGPKGVGALYIKRGITLANLMHGGAQERKRRAGTINVAGTIAFGQAAETLKPVSAELRDYLEAKIESRIEGAQIQGKGQPRLSNTSNILFDGVRGEGLVMGLDLSGFAVSSGSACNSGSILPSHVLLAMGLDKAAAASAVRVSLAHSNTKQEMDLFVDSLASHIERIRAQGLKRNQYVRH
jgi:cysteine desulfurase